MRRTILKTYVIGIDLAALAMVLLLPTTGLSDRTWTLVVLLLLAAVSGSRTVRIPSLGIQLTPSDAFVFCALGAVGPMAAPLVSFVSTLGATVGSNRRPPSIRTAFNLGSVTLSAAICAWAHVGISNTLIANTGRSVIPIMGATAVFFLSNTLLAAVAIGIERKMPVLTVWLRSGFWTGVSTITSLLVSIGLLALLSAAGPMGLALGLAGSVTLYASYRSHKRRIETAASAAAS